MKNMSFYYIYFHQFFLWSFFHVVSKYIIRTQTDIHLEHTNVHVIIANHQRVLDPFIIIGALPWKVAKEILPIKFMTWRTYFVLFLPFAFSAGCYPTRSLLARNAYRAGVKGSIRALDKGFSVLVFPEGKRVQTYSQAEAKDGVVRILNGSNIDTALLVRIKWLGARDVRVHYKTVLLSESETAQGIMNTIYAL
jgi:1-acyl-sn-glycerol-3-phosphate acyltransferase